MTKTQPTHSAAVVVSNDITAGKQHEDDAIGAAQHFARATHASSDKDGLLIK